MRRLFPAAAARLPRWSVAALCCLLGACATAPPASAPVAPVAAAATTPPEPEASGAPPATPAVPRARLDPQADAARSDLWQRVRNGFAMDDLDNELVRKWEQWYAGRPDYVERMTERGGRYLFHIVEEADRRGMPLEMALLPFIESAFNPQAVSVARAAGMWQFMPATGKDFELKQNVFRDDRRDVLASTRAALDYLQLLERQFGDWHLALAAYNWGQGNVQRAIARNQRAGLPTDYQSLRLPDETRNYVPKLQAVKNIVARPADFALTLPRLENHPFFLTVAIERDIDVALAARLADIPLDEFKSLNPQMNKPVILAAGTPQVLLPYDNANQFLHNIDRHQGPLASWTAWVVPRTLKPADAAREVGMTEAALREANRIPKGMLVKGGSTLLVQRSGAVAADVPERVADGASIAFAPAQPALRRVSFKVGKKGDSVAAVARRYRTTPAQVAQWNDVGVGSRFKAGETVVVMVPPRKKRAVAAQRPASAKATAGAKAAPKASAKAKAAPQTSAKAKSAPKASAKAKPAATPRNSPSVAQR
jgi:membrane-bound lytic murein transglycosylase D